MTQGELEALTLRIEKAFSELEIRIMMDIVRLIKENGFSSASSDNAIARMQQIGKSEEEIKSWIQEALSVSDEEIDKIFSDEVYKEYYGHDRAYRINGMEQIPLEDNEQMQAMISAIKDQTGQTFQNMTGSMGFAIRDPATGKLTYSHMREFYTGTLDNAIMDIQTGTFDYQTVLNRTINTMVNSGVRWIDYESGYHSRVDVAARRAVMTGFRQIQGKINERVAADLHTDSYEVTYHVGARPEHQPWQGRVWTMQQLQSVCGLGTVTGLHGANCYHDYSPFIPGISVRTYTDAQLEEMLEEENTPKTYNGKEYTTYEALQQQRKMERNMRASRQRIQLLEKGGADAKDITLVRARYQGQMHTYKDFSKKMKLPEQVDRVYQDGLGDKTRKTTEKQVSVLIRRQTERKALNDTVRNSIPKAKVSGVGLNTYTEKEIKEFAAETEALANKYVTKESRWSGNIIVDDSAGMYGKLWNCDIVTKSETSPHIILHELLHARSISYYDPNIFVQHEKIEEASVQLLAQEISKAERIEIIESYYDGMTDALRTINAKAKICRSDLDFAVELLQVDVPDRLDWLDSKVYESIMKSGTIQDYAELSDILEKLR